MNSSSLTVDANSTSGDSKDEGNRRVLSIQSHVVSGYVGNKAAVFPLQLLGFEVDVINSVQFSNHTGYPSGWEGEVLDGSMLRQLVGGMDRNGLLSSESDSGGIGNILTGYIGSESFLRAVVSVVQKLKDLNPKCRYICDPVLGDMGKFYVPKELVDIYRRDVLPLADVITPNQFEVEQLTGISIQSMKDAQHACSILHDLGVSLVLITSIVFPDARSDDCNASTDFLKPPSNDSIGMFASQRQYSSQSMQQLHNVHHPSIQEEHNTEHNDEQYILYTPRLDGQFTGTGDVCAALFLGWTAENDHDNENGDSYLACALEKLASTMQAIVQRTATAAAKKQSSSSSIEKAKIVSSRELQLIQSREDILHPVRTFRALRVQCNVCKPS
mmetsp:Transcript_37968/g.68375  ORF Transcript_37968/g.68375 Transcript_37968/m.68375 type:complete len:386 (-) Transcript_37968:286-1443(-)|eukprot:CAMPEP_0201891868 /NCGR_PEP_ID=MMETSP0902-20130614/35331_1 /ASSEMBLY_ACC=CAM_ASM_000551 /TAXON_ID=420261 /ORGANISM="Thalassiosira antarctica, Strain CCMP982" /LENGTH=385 /DNA_ID=CAMNT_0048423187 /DNA_START=99 /DNA_END=1256 /DNA_ORIENTATION=-